MVIGGEVAPKQLRRDAVDNRERVIQGAMVVIARDGFDAPVASIAAEAGVGVGTFYRSFVDRDALMRELQLRAYDSLLHILETIESRGVTGLAAIESYLREALAISNRLFLPLHGVKPVLDDEAVTRRDKINVELERFLAQARDAGLISSDVNATDVIICSALITQAFQFGADWMASASRHIQLFVAGLAADADLSDPPVTRLQVEAALASQGPGSRHGR